MRGGGTKCDRGFERLVDEGDCETEVEYGMRLLNRTNQERDIENGFELVYDGGERDNAKGLYETGRCFEMELHVERDKDKALEYYLRSLFKGYDVPVKRIEAVYNEKSCVFDRLRSEFEIVQRKAIEDNDGPSLRIMGICYRQGLFVEKDKEEGMRLLSVSAEKGDSYAQFNLGMCFFHGDGVEMDKEKGIRLWRVSSEQGNSDAQKILVFVFLEEMELK